MFINRNWRRLIRIGMALVGAIAAGTLVAPDYIPADWHHNIQQTCAWLATAFGVVNPFLDVGAGDAKGDKSKEV